MKKTKPITEGIIAWILDLISDKKVKIAKDMFEKDEKLQSLLDDYAKHTDQISKRMEDYCKKYGGC